MRFLKQSTSVDVAIGPFLDSTDGITAETALTITQPDVRLKKNAAAWAQKAAAQTLTHEENGWYEVTLDATDTDTLGILMVAVHETGAVPVWTEFQVLPANVYDSLFSTDFLQVDVTQLLGTAWLAPGTAGTPDVNVKLWNALPTVALPLIPTVAGRTLDVSVGGEAGLDWANIGSPTTAQNLSATNIDVDQVVASVSGAVGSVTGLTAATVHSDLDDIQARLPAALTAGGNMKSDALAVSGSTTAADNVEVVFSTDFATNYSTSEDKWSVTIDSAAVGAAVLAVIQESGVSAGAADAFSATDVDICNMALDLLKEAPIDSLTDGTPEANWLARNYGTTRDAELRDHVWKWSIKRRQLSPLDFVFDDGMSGTLTGAWGLVRLTPSWSGDLAKIRRSSDSTTDLFAAAADALEIDTDDIATFIGTGTGYADTVYDQSGNGRDWVQATTTKQPLYVADAGDADRPGLSFDGTDDHMATVAAMSVMMSTATGYMIVVGLVDAWTLDSSTASANHVLVGDSASEMGLYLRKGGRLYGVNDDGTEDATSDAAPLAEPFVAEWRHTGGIVYSRVNLGTERSSASGATTSLAGVLNVGDKSAGSQAFDGTIFAVLTFSAIPTEAERNRMVERLMRWVHAGGAQRFTSDWSYRYPIPSDSLRLLQLRSNGAFEGSPVPHELENGYILTNAATVYARYIQQFTDSTRFDPLFTEALSAKLAFKMAHWLTGKASMVQTVKALYDDAIARARRSDSFQGTPERSADNDVIDARYVGGNVPYYTTPES